MVQGSGTDVVITDSTITNALLLANHIFADFSSDKTYVAILKRTEEPNKYNLITGLVAYKRDPISGNGVRYRNGAYNSTVNITTAFDVAVTVGDVYTVYEY